MGGSESVLMKVLPEYLGPGEAQVLKKGQGTKGPGNGRKCHCPGKNEKQLLWSVQLGLGTSGAVDHGGCQGWSLNVDEGKGATE